MKDKKYLVEVDEVLNRLSKEELIKIPEELRNVIKDKKDKNYLWNYDDTKELSDQNLSRDAIAMLSYLNMEYLLNEEQKLLMTELHKVNEKKKKINKFNKNASLREDIISSDKHKALAEIESKKWYEKIFLNIKNIFYKH